MASIDLAKQSGLVVCDSNATYVVVSAYVAPEAGALPQPLHIWYRGKESEITAESQSDPTLFCCRSIAIVPVGAPVRVYRGALPREFTAIRESDAQDTITVAATGSGARYLITRLPGNDVAGPEDFTILRMLNADNGQLIARFPARKPVPAKVRADCAEDPALCGDGVPTVARILDLADVSSGPTKAPALIASFRLTDEQIACLHRYVLRVGGTNYRIVHPAAAPAAPAAPALMSASLPPLEPPSPAAVVTSSAERLGTFVPAGAPATLAGCQVTYRGVVYTLSACHM